MPDWPICPIPSGWRRVSWAFLTAYYAFRMIFILLFPRTAMAQEGAAKDAISANPLRQWGAGGNLQFQEFKEGNAHGPGGPHSGHAAGQHRVIYRVMVWPLIILAGITVLLGFLQSPLETFLGHQYPAVALPEATHIVWLPYLALLLTIGGVGLAWAGVWPARCQAGGIRGTDSGSV